MDRFFFIIAAVIFLFIFAGCQNERMPLEPIAPAEKQTASRDRAATMEVIPAYRIVAQKLAALSSDAGFRAQLREHLKRARPERRGIIMLKELREQLGNDLSSFSHEQLAQAFEQLAEHADVCFPSDEHFEKFEEGAPILVTFWATTADTPNHELTGFDARGLTFPLSPNALPKTPAMIVIACEHEGRHETYDFAALKNTPAANDLILDEIVIYDGHEPSWKGAPDIRMHVHKDTNLCRATYSNYDRWIDLPQVDVVGTVYYPNLAIWNWSLGSTFDRVLVRVYEADGPFDGNDHMAWFLVPRSAAPLEFIEPGECRIKVHTN